MLSVVMNEDLRSICPKKMKPERYRVPEHPLIRQEVKLEIPSILLRYVNAVLKAQKRGVTPKLQKLHLEDLQAFKGQTKKNKKLELKSYSELYEYVRLSEKVLYKEGDVTLEGSILRLFSCGAQYVQLTEINLQNIESPNNGPYLTASDSKNIMCLYAGIGQSCPRLKCLSLDNDATSSVEFLLYLFFRHPYRALHKYVYTPTYEFDSTNYDGPQDDPNCEVNTVVDHDILLTNGPCNLCEQEPRQNVELSEISPETIIKLISDLVFEYAIDYYGLEDAKKILFNVITVSDLVNCVTSTDMLHPLCQTLEGFRLDMGWDHSPKFELLPFMLKYLPRLKNFGTEPEVFEGFCAIQGIQVLQSSFQEDNITAMHMETINIRCNKRGGFLPIWTPHLEDEDLSSFICYLYEYLPMTSWPEEVSDEVEKFSGIMETLVKVCPNLKHLKLDLNTPNDRPFLPTQFNIWEPFFSMVSIARLDIVASSWMEIQQLFETIGHQLAHVRLTFTGGHNLTTDCGKSVIVKLLTLCGKVKKLYVNSSSEDDESRRFSMDVTNEEMKDSLSFTNVTTLFLGINVTARAFRYLWARCPNVDFWCSFNVKPGDEIHKTDDDHNVVWDMEDIKKLTKTNPMSRLERLTLHSFPFASPTAAMLLIGSLKICSEVKFFNILVGEPEEEETADKVRYYVKIMGDFKKFTHECKDRGLDLFWTWKKLSNLVQNLDHFRDELL